MNEDRLNTFIGAGLEYTNELDHLMLFVTQTREDLQDVIKMIEENDNKEDIKNHIEYNAERLDVYNELCSRTMFKLNEMLRGGLNR